MWAYILYQARGSGRGWVDLERLFKGECGIFVIEGELVVGGRYTCVLEETHWRVIVCECLLSM